MQAAAGGGREVEQSLRVRYLADAVCFPQALLPSPFLRWEAVKGEADGAPPAPATSLSCGLLGAAVRGRALRPALRTHTLLPLPFASPLPAEADAILTYAGGQVRATFTFDRWGRVARMRSQDFLRRLSDGSFESGEWQVAYSGHMLFG